MIEALELGRRFGEKRVLREVDSAPPRGGFAVVTGPNGSGKTTLLRLCAGLMVPTEGELRVSAPRAEIGYLGHEPLVDRELSALENLDLYGRLYRIAERRERIGMLLERYGLWDVRDDRVASYSRGMTQRLALCRVLLHDPALLVLDEPYTALDAQGAELLDAQLAELLHERTLLVSNTRSRAHRAARDGEARTRMNGRRRRARACAEGSASRAPRAGHAAGDASFRRRDLRRLPLLASRPLVGSRRERVALGRDRLHRAARPRPCLRSRAEQRMFDGLVLAPCDRSAIWLAKSLATFAFLALAESESATFFLRPSPRRRRLPFPPLNTTLGQQLRHQSAAMMAVDHVLEISSTKVNRQLRWWAPRCRSEDGEDHPAASPRRWCSWRLYPGCLPGL